MSPVINSPIGRQLVKAASFRSISSESPFWFGNLIHVYLELRLKVQDLEGAESIAKAKQALEYISKAADAAHLVCEQFNGQVLEIHGRTLHLGLTYDHDGEVESLTKEAVATLHVLLRRAYGSGGPESWRMAADHAPTLTVEGKGIHKDTSLVSLSPAANYPAKALGKKLVSWGELGARIQGNWGCVNLDALAASLNMEAVVATKSYGSGSLMDAVMEKRAKVVNFASAREIRDIEAKVSPLGDPGSIPSPTPENPFSCFGFVLSMDLDGFTKRVDVVSRGTPQEQMQLACDFLDIMDDAAEFARQRPEYFVQFPFAGDNAIFAVTASEIGEFGVLKKRVPIEIAVLWEQAMGAKARKAGFGGWGQSAAAGGTPHGNSKGNLHVGGIVLGERRFLVGIGQGMRYARQAFAHVDPGSDELAMSALDMADLHPRLSREFSECDSSNGGTSSYYRKATLQGLANGVAELGVGQQGLVEKLKSPAIQLTGTSVPHRPYLIRP